MKIKPILFGSSGMIGQGVLMECLESPDVESLLIINRRPSGISHPKVKEIIHEDVSDLSEISSELIGFDTCFFCLGVSAVGLNEEAYNAITYTLTTRVAEALLKVSKDITFIYISGKGTDSSEKGSMMWARVKGKTENALLAIPFKEAYMFRPGFIQPMKGIRSRTRIYNMVYFVFKPFYFILKSYKNGVTDTISLGKAMIYVAVNGYDKKIVESWDINEIAKK
jgi:uncharacterized protein YbjT (DUF2867 family)